eukprot:scaffold186401_cov35-Prasinocladus_malaysianus.AAC.1
MPLGMAQSAMITMIINNKKKTMETAMTITTRQRMVFVMVSVHILDIDDTSNRMLMKRKSGKRS